MNTFIRLITIFITTSVLWSCNNKKTGQGEIGYTDSLDYQDSFIVIDNAFTAIKKGLCDNIEFKDLQYTDKNTEIIALDPTDSTRLFLFCSELDCGYTAGNCGRTLELIKRGSDNRYVSLFEACGKLDSISKDNKDIYYSSASNRAYKINVNAPDKQILLSVHGMPYEELKQISKSTEIFEDNLVLEGEKTENLDAVPVSYTKEIIDSNTYINIYKLNNFGVEYGFAFVHYKKSTRQQIGGRGKAVIVRNEKAPFRFYLQDSTGSTTSWAFHTGKKIFSLEK